MFATGRQPYPSIDMMDFHARRELVVATLRERAHRDDVERRELQRQLDEVDRAIERGVAMLPRPDRLRVSVELRAIEQAQPDA